MPRHSPLFDVLSVQRHFAYFRRPAESSSSAGTRVFPQVFRNFFLWNSCGIPKQGLTGQTPENASPETL
jgi:hypothetical protein